MPSPDIGPIGYENHPVWRALSDHVIGPPDAALSFAARLARENTWDREYCARVIEEYHRFCFLAVVEPGLKTPSDAVDQAWHLHLTYSQDYWERFCPKVLGRALHHSPTSGGASERARYHEQYAQTLRSYERVFRADPPGDIWPGAARRLLHDPRGRRVNPHDVFIIDKRAAYAVLAAACVLALIHFIYR